MAGTGQNQGSESPNKLHILSANFALRLDLAKLCFDFHFDSDNMKI